CRPAFARLRRGKRVAGRTEVLSKRLSTAPEVRHEVKQLFLTQRMIEPGGHERGRQWLHRSNLGTGERVLLRGGVSDDDGIGQVAADDRDKRLAVRGLNGVRLVLARERGAREKDGLEDVALGANLPDGAQVRPDEVAHVSDAMARAARAFAGFENLFAFGRPALGYDQRG